MKPSPVYRTFDPLSNGMLIFDQNVTKNTIALKRRNALPPCVLLWTIVFFYACVPFAAYCIWMHVFCRSGVYYDNVDVIFVG